MARHARLAVLLPSSILKLFQILCLTLGVGLLGFAGTADAGGRPVWKQPGKQGGKQGGKGRVIPSKGRGYAGETGSGSLPAAKVARPLKASAWQEEHFKKVPKRTRLFTQDNPLLHAYVSICAVTKDDNRDIVEWVEYHRRIGVDVIYVVDNGSEDPLFTLLQPYIKAGFVVYTYMPWTPSKAQCFAYEYCVRTYGYRHRWMGFIDTDEFVVISSSHAEEGSKALNIGDVLRKYSSHDGLALNWRVYSSSGHVHRPRSVLGHYHKCGLSGSRHVKVFVNPNRIARVRNPHFVRYMADAGPTVNTQRNKVKFAFNFPPLLDVMFVNHYVTKSLEDFQRKMKRGSAAGRHRTMQFFEAMESQLRDDCPVLHMPPDVSPLSTALPAADPEPASGADGDDEEATSDAGTAPEGASSGHDTVGMAVRFQREH